ncbi:hypothetical protein [Neptunicella sp. SCSIO 80796]|uniref:hypothetical protein n=1 Tax=Neptunicella plasticusilytica TaxID=3117012 RepID=UPI003A4DC792
MKKNIGIKPTIVLMAFITTLANAQNWSPSPYPPYCHADAKEYGNLPSISIDPNYDSPNEVIVNYRALTDEDGEQRQDLGQAVNALGSMVSYAKQLEMAYNKAASNYWDHFDHTGQSDPALEQEYGYWIWRRGRFSGEVAAIKGVGYQTGAGAATFIANILGGTFGTPFQVHSLQDAVRYDYIKFSQCTLKHAQTLDDALKYETILDAYPYEAEYIYHHFERMGIRELKPDEKQTLLFAMRERRKTNIDGNGRPTTGLFADKEAVRKAIASAGSGRTPGHIAFIEFLEFGVSMLNSRHQSTELGAPKNVDGKPGAWGMSDDKYNQLSRGMLFIYFRHPSKAWNQVEKEIFPNGYVQAATCAPSRLTEAADFLYQKIGSLIDEAAKEQTLDTAFCIEPRSRLRGRRPPMMTWQQEAKACMGHDAWRLAMIACATGQQVGADPDINQALLYKYPVRR